VRQWCRPAEEGSVDQYDWGRGGGCSVDTDLNPQASLANKPENYTGHFIPGFSSALSTESYYLSLELQEGSSRARFHEVVGKAGENKAAG
jgi:hypothetical protein